MKLEQCRQEFGRNLRLATLLFLIKDDQVLLAMKKRGFGDGRWNGAGGKVEPGESVEAAVVRETEEEIGVTPVKYVQVAELDFYFPDEGWGQKVITYFCTEWQGEPAETEEMAPKWFNKTDLPLGQMWPDDGLWLSRVLAGEELRAEFVFSKNDEVLDYQIEGL